MEGYIFWTDQHGAFAPEGKSTVTSKAEADAHNQRLSQLEVDAATQQPPVANIYGYVHKEGKPEVFAKPIEIHTWIGQPLAKVVEIGGKHPMPAWGSWKRWIIARAPNGRRYGGWETSTRDLIYLKLLKE